MFAHQTFNMSNSQEIDSGNDLTGEGLVFRIIKNRFENLHHRVLKLFSSSLKKLYPLKLFKRSQKLSISNPFFAQDLPLSGLTTSSVTRTNKRRRLIWSRCRLSKQRPKWLTAPLSSLTKGSSRSSEGFSWGVFWGVFWGPPVLLKLISGCVNLS